jgi:hypothetical protein
MRPSLSKSDNALSNLTSVINGRFKRHHSIDDDYPVISSLSNDDFHSDLISTDHRVPLTFEKSLFSSELVVKKILFPKNTINFLYIESCRMV